MQLQEIEQIAYHRRDNWKEKVAVINAYDVTNGILNSEFTVSPSAEKQLFSTLGLTGTNSELSTEKDILQQAVNRKINTEQSKFIVDESQAKVYGIMSPKYVYTPDYQVIEKVVAKQGREIQPRFSTINDDYLHLGTEIKDRKPTSIVGDVIGFGYLAFNSSTGHSSLGCEMSILRLRCENGAVSRIKMSLDRVVHRGENLMLKFESAMLKAYQPDKFIEILNHAIISPKILDAPTELGEKVFKKYKIDISQKVADKVAPHFEDSEKVDGGFNNYGIYNAVTRYISHDPSITDPITRYDMTRAAYPLLTL